MFERKSDKPNERAQVGIGTLIVFIAMVLVAAIAAGVLINTAGFLQSSAEQSGEQAAEQVTNRLVEVNTVGTVNDSSGTSNIATIEMTTKLAPGSADVNLEDTTMQWVSPDESAQLVATGSDNPGGLDTFSWTPVQDNDGSISNDSTLNDPVDRAEISIDLAGSSNLTSLEGGASAELQVNTRSGGQTTVTLVVPDSLSNKNTVQL
ncbi:archaellin/type IV pilin N-terminal domain-containing protein [Halorhabdus rudnickae]|uniref:archaellin/type IV pilin N-terminal domain-containing protein n=1 Tax=Halorhabdus rudnickae TaxID=1775544 RepID=UPI0010842A4A|nr:archaellin/type IV pilin N-terminal domain-containing protein [Halorhabdus rudnickae]